MTDIPNWPRVGQTAASRVAQTLGRLATWQLAQVPQDLGLPLAACLENRPTALLVMVADRDLAVTAAAMEPTLREARSDLLLVAEERDPWFPPQCCIGTWRSGQITWHLPLVPWSANDGTLWLVPAWSLAGGPDAPAFRLVARYLKPEPLPWKDDGEHLHGLDRAAALLREARR